jgi:predicted MFS family arabinose efflux permease
MASLVSWNRKIHNRRGALCLSPILLDVARELNAGVGELGLAGGVYGAAMTLMAIASSPFQDRVPRKLALAAGISLHAVGLAAAASAQQAPWFIAGFGLCGVGAGLLLPALIAWLSDVTPYERRAATLSRTNLGWAASTLLGVPAVGVLGQYYGWRASLLVGLLLWAVVLALLACQRSAQLAPLGANRPKAAWSISAHLIPILAMTVLAFAGFYGTFPYLGAALRQSASIGAAGAGSAIAWYGAGFLLATSLGKIIDHIGKQRSLRLSLAALAAILIILPFLVAEGVWPALAAALFAWGVCQNVSFTSASALVSGLPAETRGSALALNQAALSAGMGLGSAAMGFVFNEAGFATVGAISAALTFMAFLISLCFIREPSLKPRARSHND